MIIIIKSKILIFSTIAVFLLTIVISCFFLFFSKKNSAIIPANSQNFIKWVDFKVPCSVMEKALKIDIKTHDNVVKLNWIELLSYLGAKYGGNFSNYKQKDLDDAVQKLEQGKSIRDLTSNMKLYNYYFEAYGAVLNEFVGNYNIQVKNSDNSQEYEWQSKYGLKVFSPIARGYEFGHYQDFGDQRSFGFKRVHLGNDLMGSVGTPIIAVESGYVEVMGWNRFGGWRIGIRSFDKKRYYYYAHLRKDNPFHNALYTGKEVKAGDVIGYLGMTGYSSKENVNNIKKPHLHFGMQIIFDESQKDGVNQIWIDVYNIIELLQKNKSSVKKDVNTKNYNRIFDIEIPKIPEIS